MKIIGEKINGTRKAVAKAIAEHDAEFIQNLAKKQVDAGAHWLDINAGTLPSREADDLTWLIHLVQEVVDVPLCLDSANPAIEKTPPDTSDPFLAQVYQGTSAFGRLEVSPMLVLDEGADEPKPVKTVPIRFVQACTSRTRPIAPLPIHSQV